MAGVGMSSDLTAAMRLAITIPATNDLRPGGRDVRRSPRRPHTCAYGRGPSQRPRLPGWRLVARALDSAGIWNELTPG